MLAQAFLCATAIVVLDEPSSGLDQTARAALAELMEEARATGTAVLTSAQSTLWLPEGASTLHLAGGHLYTTDQRPTVPGPESGLVRIEAMAPPGTDRQALSQRDGVTQVTVSESGQHLELLVEPEVLDALMYELLGQGWSIRTVSPAVSENPEPRP